MPPHLDDSKTRACTLKTMSKERFRAEVGHNRDLEEFGDRLVLKTPEEPMHDLRA